MNNPPLKPRFHGNGFIQVYLNPLTRLHIWHPEFPALASRKLVENARIHDHRYGFTSQVLMGGLINEVYGVTPALGEAKLYQQGPGHSDKSSPLEFASACVVKPISKTLYETGDVYTMDGPGHYHDSTPLVDEITVTVMTKTNIVSDYRARMVALDGREPDHAFESQPDEALLREVLAMVMFELT